MAPGDELDALPPWWRGLGRALRLCRRAGPRLMWVAGLTTLAAALPDVLFAVGVAALGRAVAGHRGSELAAAAGLLAVLAAAGWLLGTVASRLGERLSERAAVRIEAHLAGLEASVPTVEHHERPEILARMARLRDWAGGLSELPARLFDLGGGLLRLGVTLALLMSVRPVFGLLGLFAVPMALLPLWRSAVGFAAEERVEHLQRRARRLFDLGTDAGTGKEIRVSGAQERLGALWAEAWHRRNRVLARVGWCNIGWSLVAFGLFGAAFAACLVVEASTGSTGSGPARAGGVLLVLAAGGRLSGYLARTVDQFNGFRTIWVDQSRRLVWLEGWAAAGRRRWDAPVPDALTAGIVFEDVSFRYPGTDRPVLEGVSLRLPAGAVVAVVGENGAGKSTLVKLLCRLYEPSGGRILVDGVPLDRMPADGWRSRLTGAFQDFFPFEFTAARSVGLGDLPRIDDRDAVAAAVVRAGADSVLAGLPDGPETRLGTAWEGGVELSHGQWQRIALARGFMRGAPLLRILDEPTSALDAETEHVLFARYAAEARREGAAGGVTVLVSHRFSTVRAADLIVVLDGAQVVEQGSHRELMAAGGRYAELYGVQAAAYR
ncbi:hypothetical protein BIV57_21750 [Mangrovactinospora gilvigrisea]|uniref:ABC transporter ATP-binding protein n=1 Tax=Mangrovactinospora gilvigrisea TaxID=1428644 RepID=A0A1J7C6Z4_9ACTN|nr:ABC transporter ATP-binding protein [Mangrovactinospora gilvigrisea]OIV35418.1 hypothetical protein BIV57_21750 [Mangrovactinospora gilvigrisea]